MSQEKQYPLPDGVDDIVLNRGQMARALNVSEPTIDRWIVDGLPVLEGGGGGGRPYKFQLSACWSWKCARDDDERIATAEAERAVQQMRLALVGGSVGDQERAFSAKQRSELYAAEYHWMQAARARGQLTPIERVEDLLEEVFSLVRDAVVALPDRLQRECNLDGRQVEKAVTACDDLLSEAHRKMQEQFELMRVGEVKARCNGFEVQ